MSSYSKPESASELRAKNRLSSLTLTDASKRKVSLQVDTAKLTAASEILGTRTPAATVEAALSAVIGFDQRRRLIELLCTPGALELADRAVMDSAWR